MSPTRPPPPAKAAPPTAVRYTRRSRLPTASSQQPRSPSRHGQCPTPGNVTGLTDLSNHLCSPSNIFSEKYGSFIPQITAQGI